MPPSRRPARSVPLLVLHGLEGPGPEHWYSWLATELRESGREVRLPALPDSSDPERDVWLGLLRDELATLPDNGFDVVAHSAGALLWLHHAASRPDDLPRPARVALTALPSDDLIPAPSFRDAPLDPDAVRAAADGTVLVGGDDDQYCPPGMAVAYGVPLKIATTMIEGGGHLNPDSGYGPWPAMLDWCRRDNLAFY